MFFPKTRSDLISAGYALSVRGVGVCGGCHKKIEWWITPAGKRMPMDLMPDDTSAAISHFTVCPYAKNFRKRQAAATAM